MIYFNVEVNCTKRSLSVKVSSAGQKYGKVSLGWEPRICLQVAAKVPIEEMAWSQKKDFEGMKN